MNHLDFSIGINAIIVIKDIVQKISQMFLQRLLNSCGINHNRFANLVSNYFILKFKSYQKYANLQTKFLVPIFLRKI